MSTERSRSVRADGRPVVGLRTIGSQLSELGIERGGVVVVHTSFGAVGPVENGPDGLIDALLEAVGPEGTIVMPSWPDTDGIFDPAATPAAPDLGVTADRFWRRAGALRASHPHAFTALGPHAEAVLADPLPLPPHRPESPIGRVRDLGGQVLLLGTGHDANTTIHLAELEAGVTYRRPKSCTVLENGRPRVIEYAENDHCCARFSLVDEWVEDAGVQRRGRVGHAETRLVPAREVVRLVVARLRREPFFFLHDDGAGCRQCDEARAWAVKQPSDPPVLPS